MRLFSYNILNGGVGRADPIGEVIEAQNADVVVLSEADDDWVVQRIARRLKMDIAVGGGEKHAAAILSRLPIAETINHAAIDPAGPRSWLEAKIEPKGEQPFSVFAVHLTPRATLKNEKKRVDELERLLAGTRMMRETKTPHLLVGDFNSNAPGQTIDIARCKPATQKAFAENGGLIPRDAISLLLKNGYIDSLVVVRGDAAFEQVTFTTHEPGQRVDYAFGFGIEIRDAWVETDRLATYASDHYPIGVEFSV